METMYKFGIAAAVMAATFIAMVLCYRFFGRLMKKNPRIHLRFLRSLAGKSYQPFQAKGAQLETQGILHPHDMTHVFRGAGSAFIEQMELCCRWFGSGTGPGRLLQRGRVGNTSVGRKETARISPSLKCLDYDCWK